MAPRRSREDATVLARSSCKREAALGGGAAARRDVDDPEPAPDLAQSASPPDAGSPDAGERSSTARLIRIPPASRVARRPFLSSAAMRPSVPVGWLRARIPTRQAMGTVGPVLIGSGSPPGNRSSLPRTRSRSSSRLRWVTVSRSSLRRIPRTSARTSSTIRSASSRAVFTVSSRSRRARRRSSSAPAWAIVARSSAIRTWVNASATSACVALIDASVSSNACCSSVNRERASATIGMGRPSRSAIAKAWLRPGSPIVSLKVGRRVSTSNSTEALRADAVVWA